MSSRLYISFFIPFLYSLNNRVKRYSMPFKIRTVSKFFLEIIYWNFIILTLIIFKIFLFSRLEYSDIMKLLGAIVFNFIILYTFYEIGYIHNDLYSVRKEKNPTPRIPLNQPSWLIISAIAFRLILTSGMLLIYPLIFRDTQLLLLNAFFIILTLTNFFIYNSTEKWMRSFSIFNLRFCKIIFPTLFIYYFLQDTALSLVAASYVFAESFNGACIDPIIFSQGNDKKILQLVREKFKYVMFTFIFLITILISFRILHITQASITYVLIVTICLLLFYIIKKIIIRITKKENAYTISRRENKN